MSIDAPIVALTHVRLITASDAVYETFSPERFQLGTAAMAMLDPEVRREAEQNHAVVVKGDPAINAKDFYNVTTVFRVGVGYDSAKLRDAARGLVGVR